MIRTLLALGAALLVLTAAWPANAQPAPTFPAAIVLLAPDDNGVEQVWRIDPTSGQTVPLTNAPTDVIAYDVVGNSVAYVAGDTLYQDGEARATLAPNGFAFPTVALDADATRIAYSDGAGLWLYENDAPHLIVAHLPGLDDVSDLANGRHYYLPQFVPHHPNNLMITVALWEAAVVGSVDLQSGRVTELVAGRNDPSTNHLTFFTNYTILNDGRILLYSTSPMLGCNPCGIWSAPSPAEITAPSPITDSNLPLAIEIRGYSPDQYLIFPIDIVEIGVNRVRVVVEQTMIARNGQASVMQVVGDFDLETGTMSHITAARLEGDFVVQARLSPDASALVGLTAMDYAQTGLYGMPVVERLATDERLAVFPKLAHDVRWARR